MDGAPPANSGYSETPIDVSGLVCWLARFAELIARDRGRLTQLDAAIGDGDYGVNMDRGMAAVVARLPELAGEGATARSLCSGIGLTMISTVGGTSGPLYGTFFLRFGAALGDVIVFSPWQLAAALSAGLDGVVTRGRAKLGDKTMVDAMIPAVTTIETEVASGNWSTALARGARAAAAGCARVTPLVSRKGRASYLGERSVGHADPGATSTVLLFEALRDAVAPADGGS